MTGDKGVVAAVTAIIMVFGLLIGARIYVWYLDRQYDKEHKCPNCREYTLTKKSEPVSDLGIITEDWMECTSCGWYE